MGVKDAVVKMIVGKNGERWKCSPIDDTGFNRVCERVMKDGEGQEVATGSMFEVFANPETCAATFGTTSLKDDEWEDAAEIASKVTGGCKVTKRGYTSG
mgnify:CR=1 FL=1